MKFTAALLIAIAIVVIAIVDVYLIMTGETAGSISHQIIAWSHEYPVFTFLVGFTMGHLFWRMKSIREIKEKKHREGVK
jgi:hypothetical protein